MNYRYLKKCSSKNTVIVTMVVVVVVTVVVADLLVTKLIFETFFSFLSLESFTEMRKTRG